MSAVRRWYILLVCAVSLQSVAWAAIALLRNLLTVGREVPATTIALQVAIVVIGLPLYLVHWLWAQRLAMQIPGERASAVRRLYLYGTLAGLLAPFIANTFDIVWELSWLALGGATEYTYSSTPVVVHDLSAIVVLALLWSYHYRVTSADARAFPESGNTATVRRLYILGFAAAGVAMTTLAIIHLLRWIMFNLGTGDAIAGGDPSGLSGEVARLIVGLPLWLVFWRRAQRLFAGASQEERESALRKLCLYLAVFVASLTVVTNVAFMLAGLFRRLLALPPRGDIRVPLPIVIGVCVVWAYHAYVLRGDAAVAGASPRQAAVRRLYLYLVAGVGLAAFLVGLSGDISVLIRSMSARSFGGALAEQLASFSAALIAGLPVWLLPWRQAQILAVSLTPAAGEERRSVVRKIFLYSFLFVATMAVLSGAVYIVWQLLTIALGERPAPGLSSNLAQAIAFSLIGVGVWLYHGSALRADGRLAKRGRVERLSSTRVTVLDAGDGRFGRAVLDGLRRDLPGLALDPIGLTDPAARAMGIERPVGDQQKPVARRLAEAGLIVGPWDMVVAGRVGGSVTAEIAEAVAGSPGRKLLAPTRIEGWEWAGVDRWDAEALARQTVLAITQIALGEDVRPVRPLTAGAIIGIIVGVLFLLILLAFPVLYYFGGL